jgi:potassium efflux system protein
MIATFGIIAAGAVLLAMTLRWYSCKKRKLALAEVMERRRQRQEAQAAEDKSDRDEVVSVDAEEEVGLDLNAIGEQTSHVFRMIFAVGVIMTITYLWSENLPIYSALENIRVPLTQSLSLFSLLKAILIAVVTWIIVQNLPGLLELSVLRNTSFTTGTRYAISRLCQYITVGIGLMAFFNVLQFDWSKFSWIAAALSVGLGFGLQEVVANFVCGLILLFERPVRVGDIVTLENMTGTVTNIQMRSTTITNWDRQEFIVPNKQLITGTILNWTLSASVNRVVIPVGVAYGSDTEKARQILLDVATEHPLIMDDPAPSANFEQFADSSLLIILRAYLPNLDNRLTVITELHTSINQRFADEGVEIAFPQLDIHLRNGANESVKQLMTPEQSFQ